MTAIPNRKREGKYLTFALGDEEYGIDALKVQGILGMQPITPMPQAPHYVKVATIVRANALPLSFVRLKLCTPEVVYSSPTFLILDSPHFCILVPFGVTDRNVTDIL